MRKLSKIFVMLFMLIAILTVNSKVYADEKSGEVDQAVWGIKTDYRGHSTYIKSDDYSIQWTTQLTKDLCWLRGDYQSYQAWYGFDNSKGTYEDGSMFWVKMIFSDSLDYNYYEQRLDEDYSTNESDSNWIIIFGVTKPDGTITELDSDKDFLKDIDLYIQIGDMWDKGKVNNYLEEINQKRIEYVSLDKEGIKGVFAKVGDSSSYVGTVFGEGNVYIICGITVIVMALCLGIIIYVKKRRLKVNSSED
jgi:hypothetical protein